ncbi:thiamine phosphate synthase [Nocardioides sp. MH1]|uniref:thiamine phosphate synthase n=1 Tax=Nocardioides sp. MH1 TaxID=3242490 RepID=UPI0035201088
MTRLVVVTDRAQLALGRGLLRTVRECVEAGLGAVLVREHDLPPARRHALVAALAAIEGLTVVSSRLDDPAAHGVHLAAHQPVVVGRFGRSCHSRAEVARAAEEGARWATLSPYALSGSKPGYGPPLPIEEYAGLPLPTYALGGVTAANAAEAVGAGARGVAVMGEVMRAPDPAGVVRRLLEVLR